MLRGARWPEFPCSRSPLLYYDDIMVVRIFGDPVLPYVATPHVRLMWILLVNCIIRIAADDPNIIGVPCTIGS